MDLDECWKHFTNVMHEGINKFVPKSKPQKRKQPIWMNHKALKSIKKKYTLYKRYLSNKTHFHYQKYLEARNEAKRQLRKAVKEYELKLYKEHAKSVTRSNFHTLRINSTWNSLSYKTRSSENVLAFKKGIDSVLSNLMFQYD